MEEISNSTPNILDSLPHGSINQIAKQCNLSRMTVYKVLNNIDTYSGKQDTYAAVVKAATEILNKRNRAMTEIKDPFIKALQGCKI